MLEITNMDIGQVEYEGFADGKDGSHDWELALIHATYRHKDACEFIFYLGSEGENTYLEYFEKYKALGFSSTFLDYIAEAQLLKFNYLNFYAN